MGFQSKGASSKYKPEVTRRDTRRLGTVISEELFTLDGAVWLMFIAVCTVALSMLHPFGGPIALFFIKLMFKKYGFPKLRFHNFPWRVPIQAKLPDGSMNAEIMNKKVTKEPEKFYGEGVTYLGYDHEKKLQAYSSFSDDKTHMVVLGTTGSGKTEFLLGLVANQLVQNSGFIYCDAKGDPSLQRHIYRLLRRFGRDDDLLTINFITSGRDLVKSQKDKLTNTFNMMSNTSSGMLVELLNNLLDDSGGGGDMWKGRAMAFIAALTRPLVYMRDLGFIQLSPKTYLEYMELPALEELVFNHNGKFGTMFDKVCQPLSAYVRTLPGYNTSPQKFKKQDQKTLEQHGFIVMQLTRAINELTFSYGHIFGVEQGDIDIFDIVLNRRILTIPLPALERTPESLKMLGKLCVGAVKQMMAGSLGNRIEGLRRVILDSRPTNAKNTYKLILDEWGYIVVKGASVMPAQARSLNFSITFAAQDFSDIKRGSPEEAEATWANSTVKVIGRITTGTDGDSYKKIAGFAGEEEQSMITSTERHIGDVMERNTPSNILQYQAKSRLPFEDLAGQENGEFTLLLSKKSEGGKISSVSISRIYGFYTAGPEPKYLRLNDLAPIFTIEKSDIFDPYEQIESFIKAINTDFTLRTDKSSAGGGSSNLALTTLIVAAENNMAVFDANPTNAFLTAIAAFKFNEQKRSVGVKTTKGISFGSGARDDSIIKEAQKTLTDLIIAKKEEILTTQAKNSELRVLEKILGYKEEPSEKVLAGEYQTVKEFTDKDNEKVISLINFDKPLTIFNVDYFYDEIIKELQSVNLKAENISKYRLIQGDFESLLGEGINEIQLRELAAAQHIARSQTLEDIRVKSTISQDEREKVHEFNSELTANLIKSISNTQTQLKDSTTLTDSVTQIEESMEVLKGIDWEKLRSSFLIS